MSDQGLTYAVDLVFCIDVSGSMRPILDEVKRGALSFYADVQANLTAKSKNVDQLRVRVIAYRDLAHPDEVPLEESPFFTLPAEQDAFAAFVERLSPAGGGDHPESGLEAIALAISSDWTRVGDRRRQVIVVYTDAETQPLGATPAPPELAGRIPSDFSALTDLWENEQGTMGLNTKRLIVFAPDGSGWSEISSVWENVIHHPSKAGSGLSEIDYGTILDSIGNSV